MENYPDEFDLSKPSFDEVYNHLKGKNFQQAQNRIQEKDTCDTLLARDYKDPKLVIEEEKMLIKNATQKGYLEAEDGDGIDISSRMESHRGTVQKNKAQTITTMGGENVGVVVKNSIPEKVVKVGNYSPSGHNASSIVDAGGGVAPTVMENHGTVTAIIEDEEK